MCQHTPDCLLREELYRAWIAAYPLYCEKCGATGVHSWSENQAPFGSGYSWLERFDEVCPHCIEAEKCPRCHADLAIDWDAIETSESELYPPTLAPCPVCGWNWGRGDNDSRPDFECYCYELEETHATA